MGQVHKVVLSARLNLSKGANESDGCDLRRQDGSTICFLGHVDGPGGAHPCCVSVNDDYEAQGAWPGQPSFCLYHGASPNSFLNNGGYFLVCMSLYIYATRVSCLIVNLWLVEIC